MKNTGCLNGAQPEWYRVHYCGLCKSIGRKYDQKSRLFLNYDTVFLSEILSLLAAEDTDRWDKKIQGYRCFSLPDAADIPVSLDYASDVNMLLAQLHVQDNQTDDVKTAWALVETIFRKPFRKIQPLLQKWKVDENVLHNWLMENQKKETRPMPSCIQDWQQALSEYAIPTASLTGYFFALGADAINKPEAKEKLYQLGYRFGALIYSLDAVKDLPEDLDQGQFNPLSTFFGTARNQKEMLATAKDYLWELSGGIEQSIAELPLPEDLQKSMRGRLLINLSRELNGPEQSCQTPKTGIEKSTIPKFYRLIDSVLTRLNPVYPGKFALSYLLFLGIFFMDKLMASVKLVTQQSPENVDWVFLSATISVPVLAHLVAKRLKKWRILLWLTKIKARIKKKIAKLKEQTGLEANWLVIFLLVLLVLLILVALLAKQCADGTSSCCQSCSSDCSE